jgi:transcriptional regulator with XRE-family HTH domain
MKQLTPPAAKPKIPRPEPPDLARVSSDHLLETVVVIEQPFTRARVRAMQRWTKEHWFWSAADLARRLDCSRSQLKRIESGSRDPSEMFLVHFRSLEKQIAAWRIEHRADEKEIHVVESSKPLPRRWRVLRPIVRCRVCGTYFEQVNSRHRKCTPDCRRRGARRARSVRFRDKPNRRRRRKGGKNHEQANQPRASHASRAGAV